MRERINKDGCCSTHENVKRKVSWSSNLSARKMYRSSNRRQSEHIIPIPSKMRNFRSSAVPRAPSHGDARSSAVPRAPSHADASVPRAPSHGDARRLPAAVAPLPVPSHPLPTWDDGYNHLGGWSETTWDDGYNHLDGWSKLDHDLDHEDVPGSHPNYKPENAAEKRETVDKMTFTAKQYFLPYEHQQQRSGEKKQTLLAPVPSYSLKIPPPRAGSSLLLAPVPQQQEKNFAAEYVTNTQHTCSPAKFFPQEQSASATEQVPAAQVGRPRHRASPRGAGRPRCDTEQVPAAQVGHVVTQRGLPACRKAR